MHPGRRYILELNLKLSLGINVPLHYQSWMHKWSFSFPNWFCLEMIWFLNNIIKKSFCGLSAFSTTKENVIGNAQLSFMQNNNNNTTTLKIPQNPHTTLFVVFFLSDLCFYTCYLSTQRAWPSMRAIQRDVKLARSSDRPSSCSIFSSASPLTQPHSLLKAQGDLNTRLNLSMCGGAWPQKCLFALEIVWLLFSSQFKKELGSKCLDTATIQLSIYAGRFISVKLDT